MRRRVTWVTMAILCFGWLMTGQPAGAQGAVPSGCEDAVNGVGPFAGAEVQFVGYDSRIGGAGSQVIVGTDGDDFIHAGSGDDLVCGGGGADTIVGGSGSDVLYGDGGEDWLDGGSGNDVLDGGAEGAVCDGGSGFNEKVNCGEQDPSVDEFLPDVCTPDGAGGFDCYAEPFGPIDPVGCGESPILDGVTTFTCIVEGFDGSFDCTGTGSVEEGFITLDCHPIV